MKRSDRARLDDILEAIDKIEEKTRDGRASFDRDEMVRVWVLHHLEVLGEASRGLSLECKERMPEVPWTRIGGLRNFLAHEYFSVEADIVWNVVEKELPFLKKWVKEGMEKWVE
jgi:uncharacterized protein with HEPN domain